jgi:hypothetical protein
MSTKNLLGGSFLVAMAALVPFTECGIAVASRACGAGTSDLAKCDEDGPGQHSREIFAQAVASGSIGASGSAYGAGPSVLQFIDAHHVPPPDRWFPVATEPASTVSLWVAVDDDVPIVIDLDLVRRFLE